MAASDMTADPLERVLAELGPEDTVRRRAAETFARLAGGASKAVIFGCGPLGTIIRSGARQAGLEVVAFADNNPARQGGTLDGTPIMSPADAVSQHGRDAFFVVGVYNSSGPRQQLRALGCEPSSRTRLSSGTLQTAWDRRQVSSGLTGSWRRRTQSAPVTRA